MKRVLLLALLCLLALGGAQVVRAAASFIDPTGDSGAAPDIMSVAAANDAAGNLTFTVRTNQAAIAENSVLMLLFDLDDNPDTGGDGVEVFLVVGPGGWQLGKWNGTQFASASTPSANAGYANGTLTFKIGKADLGAADSFAYAAVSFQFDEAGEIAAGDIAPDGAAMLIYELTKPLTLRAGATTAAPAAPKAGKSFVVRTRVTRGDTGGPLASGTVTCTVRVGTAVVRATGRVAGGLATCTMTLPKTAKGKLVRGTMKVTLQGVSTTKSFSYRVR